MCTQIQNYLLCKMLLPVSTLPPAGKILSITVLIGPLLCFFILRVFATIKKKIVFLVQ